MKIIKVRKDLLFAVNPLVILVGFLLFVYCFEYIPLVFSAFWICTAIVAFLVFSPYGALRLAHQTDEIALRLPLPHWIFCIALLELTLLGIYYGISYINGVAMPINIPVSKHLFNDTLKVALLQDGLFPWNLYALTAVGLGILTYRQETNGYFSNLLKPITQHDTQETIGLIVNTGIRRCTLFALSTTVLFMTLILVFLIAKAFGIRIDFGFNTGTLVTTLALLSLSFTNTAKHHIYRIFSKRISTALSFPIVTLTLAAAILILSILTGGITQNTTAEPPKVVLNWIAYDYQTAWSIFSFMWWLCLTPMVCGFILRISKGYQVRDIILGVLALPIVITISFLHPALLSWILAVPSEHFWLMMALLCFVILLPMLLNHANSSNAILSYFPKDGVIKARDHMPFFFRIIQILIVCLYIYLAVGINGLSLVIFAPNILTIVTLLIGAFGVLKNILTLSLKE